MSEEDKQKLKEYRKCYPNATKWHHRKLIYENISEEHKQKLKKHRKRYPSAKKRHDKSFIILLYIV